MNWEDCSDNDCKHLVTIVSPKVNISSSLQNFSVIFQSKVDLKCSPRQKRGGACQFCRETCTVRPTQPKKNIIEKELGQSSLLGLKHNIIEKTKRAQPAQPKNNIIEKT